MKYAVNVMGLILAIIGVIGLVIGWIWLCWNDPEMAKHSASLWAIGTTLYWFWYFGVMALIGALLAFFGK